MSGQTQARLTGFTVRACDAVGTYAQGIADQAGSISIVGAAERGFAETAAALTKIGIPTEPSTGVSS